MKIFLGVLAAITFLGSLVLTSLGLIAPINSYAAEPELMHLDDGDCALFICICCFCSTFLLAISLLCLKFGKSGFAQKIAIKVIYLFWLIITLARMFYAATYSPG